MTKKSLMLTGLATVALTTVTVGSAMAYRGDPNTKGPNYTPERHEAMTKAFAEKDFNAWKELRQGRGHMAEVIDTQEKFEKFAQARQLMLDGKTDEASKIRAELGLGNGQGRHANGQGRGYGRFQK